MHQGFESTRSIHQRHQGHGCGVPERRGARESDARCSGRAPGHTFASLLESKSIEVFRKSFSALNESEQAAIYLRIVQSAGRGNAIESAFANTLGNVGRRLFLVSLGVAVYEIYEAEDKSRETVRQGALAGASAIGGWGAGVGAVASDLCAATAPICVGVAALLGGLLFAFGADLAFGTAYPAPRK